MQFTFENNLDDLSVLFDYYTSKSGNKKLRLWNAAKFPIFAFCGFIGAFAVSKNSVEEGIAGAAVLSLVLVAWAWLAYKYLPRKAAKMMQKENPDSTLCQTLAISPEGITKQTDVGSDFIPWQNVYDFKTLKEHILLHAPGLDLVIPKRALGDKLFAQVGNEILIHLKGQKKDVFDLW